METPATMSNAAWIRAVAPELRTEMERQHRSALGAIDALITNGAVPIVAIQETASAIMRQAARLGAPEPDMQPSADWIAAANRLVAAIWADGIKKYSQPTAEARNGRKVRDARAALLRNTSALVVH